MTELFIAVFIGICLFIGVALIAASIHSATITKEEEDSK